MGREGGSGSWDQPGRTTGFCYRKVTGLGFRDPCRHKRKKSLDIGSAFQSLQTSTDNLLLLRPSAVFTELLLRNHGGDKEV